MKALEMFWSLVKFNSCLCEGIGVADWPLGLIHANILTAESEHRPCTIYTGLYPSSLTCMYSAVCKYYLWKKGWPHVSHSFSIQFSKYSQGWVRKWELEAVHTMYSLGVLQCTTRSTIKSCIESYLIFFNVFWSGEESKGSHNLPTRKKHKPGFSIGKFLALTHVCANASCQLPPCRLPKDRIQEMAQLEADG